MRLLREGALTLSVVGAASLSLAAVAIASGGGLPPGDYVFTNTSAKASFTAAGGGKGAPGFDVTVNRGLNSVRPEDGGGPPVVTRSTMLTFFEFSPATGGGGGCFLINPGDFTVSRNVQSAALHTTLTAANVCPGIGAPVTGAGISAPPAGGGGGGLVYPIKLDVTWSGRGVTATNRDTNAFTCADFSSRSTNLSRSAGADATGTDSALDGSFTTNFAAVLSTDTHLAIEGAPLPACFGI
jgi:hypothetical protein